MSINKVKGTYDLLPNETKNYQALEAHIKRLMRLYNYGEIRTPIMEYSEVFHRDSENSDMVTKETYDFLDRGNRKITLRPEGTAGVVRSYVEHKLYTSNEVEKLYYIGPKFRYERPQKGRYRQFTQFGIEAIGATSAIIDAEAIALSYQFIQSLGLKGVKVRVNSLGDQDSRVSYLAALVAYFTPFEAKLSFDSKARLIKNPLRILDSKDPVDQEIIKDAPKPIDYLNQSSKAYFNDVLNFLNAADIKYEVAPMLVRGLDYYAHTVFEIEANIEGFGAQNVLGGGGRYENLVKELGGPKLGAIGVAFGMERLMLALEAENITLSSDITPDVFIITFDHEQKTEGFKLLTHLRNHDISASTNYTNKPFKSQLKHAIKENAKYLIMIGEEEVANKTYTVKNTKTQIQEKIKENEIIEYLKTQLGK